MSYSLQALPNEPIIYLTVSENYDPIKEMRQIGEELIQLLNTQPAPCYFIDDISKAKFNFEAIVVSANYVTREENAPLQHPNIYKVLFIATNEGAKTIARGLTTTTFGNVPLEIFDTVEEAFAYARAGK